MERQRIDFWRGKWKSGWSATPVLGLQKKQKPHLTFMVKMEFKAVTSSCQNRDSLENKHGYHWQNGGMRWIGEIRIDIHTLLSHFSRVWLCSPIPGILQARTLEWVAISFSNVWKWKVKVKSFSHVWLFSTPWTAAHQAPPSMGFSRQEYWSGESSSNDKSQWQPWPSS